ncbi:MAG TPA: phospholipase D-like domain-containing protein [Steroidobacteraceae bacterium]|nr:phospholipase D-like domain-containing protein [Steroidobacteraceae bacterium]
MTRRAPPLENISRHSSTELSVHRPSGRWTAILPAVLLFLGAAALTGCQVLPEVSFARRLPLSRSHTPVDLVSPDGMVSRAARLRATRRLARVGETELLDYHLAAMRDLGAPPLLTGNGVQLLIDGPSTYRAMFRAIESARDYIFVESFIFEEAVEGDRHLSRLLQAAAARGVRIFVIYDAVGSLTTPQEFLAGLKSADISLCAFNPLNPLDDRFAGLNQRDHRKIVVVDGEQAYAGGVNFSHAYRIASQQVKRGGLSRRKAIDEGWRDTHIGLRGTAAKELERLFRDTWARAKCQGELPPFTPQAVRGGDVLVQIVASTPDDDRNVIYVTLLSVLAYAQRSVDITMAYFVPDDALEKALREAAGRGVRVRMILPSYSDFAGVFYAGRAHYDELLEAGVEIYELESAFLHSKSIVVDGVWSSIGSTNFDWRSFVHNDEISVCVIDQGFAREMNAAFDRDLADSRRITAESWRHRGLAERLKELLWLPLQYWL